MRQSTVSTIVTALLLATGSLNAQTPSPSSSEPAPIMIGSGSRTFSTSSARGSFLAIYVVPSAKMDELTQFMRTLAADRARLAGVRFVVAFGGTSDSFAAARDAAAPQLQEVLYHDVDGVAEKALAIGEQCKGTASTSCLGIVLLNEAGKEVHRAVGALSASQARFETLLRKVADLTRDRESSEGNLEQGLALQGYDPVSYIDDQRPVIGDKRFESNYRGVVYRFATAAHRESFNANPEKYVPAYGGWCATAMAKGEKVEVDPKNFKVTDGRLFLFYKGIFGNALNDWKVDEKGLTVKADGYWKKLTGSK